MGSRKNIERRRGKKHLRKQLDRFILVLFFCVVVGSAFQYHFLAPNDVTPLRDIDHVFNELIFPKIAQSEGNPDSNLTWGGTNDDSGQGALDPSGQYFYLSGTTKSFGDSDGDLFLAKFWMNGTQLWNRTCGSVVNDIGYDIAVETSTGNIYQVAYYNGVGDALLIKWTPDGTQLWNHTWGKTGAGNAEFGTDVAIDTSGNVYITGETESFGAGLWDAFVVKYDSQGTQLWNHTWGGTAQECGNGVAVDQSGNLYLAAETTTFSAGDYDCVLVKYDPTGTQLWNRTWGGIKGDQGMGVKVDAVGNIYEIGRTKSFNAANYDAMIIKYDSDGTKLWNTTFGGNLDEYGYNIAFDSANNPYVVGYTYSFGAGACDIFYAKYTSSGFLLWNRTWGGIGNDYSTTLILQNDDTFYLPGATSNWGAGGLDSVMICIHHRPSVDHSGDMNYTVGTTGHAINWTIYDAITSESTYTVYKNDSVWGTPDQAWTTGTTFGVNVDGLTPGDYNFTLIANDGYGLSAQKMVLVTVLPHVPYIDGPTSTSYGYSTVNHYISWTFTDGITSGATYTIYHNDSVFGTPDQAWVNGLVVTCNVGDFSMGDHNVTIVAQDGCGYVSQSMTLVSVTHAPVITGPSEANYTSGTTNNNLTWYMYDNITGSPTHTIYRNGSTWGTPNQPWTNGTNVSINVDGLFGGYHNFSILAEDGLGWSSWATTILAVHSAPVVTCPSEIYIVYGSTNNVINWTVLDNTTLDPHYIIYRNGSTWGIPNQPWTNGTNISINVDGLFGGYHNFSILVEDGLGWSSCATIILAVHSSPVVTCPSEIYIFHGSINNLINWIVLDNTTIDRHYSIYRNGSIWGIPNQSWTNNQLVSTNIDGLPVGDHIFTLFVQDGYGFTTQKIIVVTISKNPNDEGISIEDLILWIGSPTMIAVILASLNLWLKYKGTGKRRRVERPKSNIPVPPPLNTPQPLPVEVKPAPSTIQIAWPTTVARVAAPVTGRTYVTAQRQFEYVGGKVRVKAKVTNVTPQGILRVRIALDVPNSFQLLRIEPSEYDREGTTVKLNDLLPKEEKAVAWVLEPLICGLESIGGTISGFDASGTPFAVPMKPLEIQVRCPLFVRPEEVNLPTVQRMLSDLAVKSERIFYLPPSLSPIDALEVAKAAISVRDVIFVGTFASSQAEGAFDQSAWFYGTTKVGQKRYILTASVSEKDRAIRIFTACDDEAGCTGFLAEAGAAIRRELVQRGAVDSEEKVKELVCEKCGGNLPRAPTIGQDIQCPECRWTWRVTDFFR